MNLSAIVPLPVSVADNKAVAFTPLVGQAPLARVVRVMLSAVDDPGRVIVAAAEALACDVDESLASHGLSSVRVVTVPDEATRAQCVLAALAYVDSETVSSTHVVLHDISRPLVSAAVQDRVIAGLRNGGAVVVPALPVTDSVKTVDTHGSVTGTLDRSALRAIQYPRGFAVDQLSQLLEQRTSDDFDELRAAIGAGVSITVVDGACDGFRIDLPRDEQYVDALIASRRLEPHGS
jgi:2-C-methyl-D-erythritol 4-phosphate cytidylyltransferase